MDRTFLTLPSLWVGLHGGDPGEDGAGEIGPYERQQVRFDAAGVGTVANREAMQYDGLPGATITHFGVWDAKAEGRYLTGGALDIALIVPAGRSLRWREGELLLRIP
jgi:hypothetical protein